jgi:hypothetical protein
MTDTTVTYHADGYGPARPGINVKSHHSGMHLVHELQRLVGDPAVVLGESVNCRYPSDRLELAYERVQSDFWQAAEELANQYGLGPIIQEGRSGGWLVFTDGRDPAEPGTLTDTDTLHGAPYGRADWLRAYAAFSAWADAYIASVPGRIARLAHDAAMDDLGARTVFLGRLRWPGYDVSTQTYEISTRSAAG